MSVKNLWPAGSGGFGADPSIHAGPLPILSSGSLPCHSELDGAYEKRPMALPNVIFSISLLGNDFFSESLFPRVAFDVSGNGQAKAELLSLLDRFECPIVGRCW